MQDPPPAPASSAGLSTQMTTVKSALDGGGGCWVATRSKFWFPEHLGSSLSLSEPQLLQLRNGTIIPILRIIGKVNKNRYRDAATRQHWTELTSSEHLGPQIVLHSDGTGMVRIAISQPGEML